MKTDLPEYIANAIREAWPDGIIEMPDTDEAPFWDTYPKLKARLSRIPGSTTVYERQPYQGTHWDEGSDPEDDPPDWREEPRSYYLIFLSPADESFRFETETMEPDEEGIDRRVRGYGRIGCVVGISLVAPFAIVGLDEMEVFESGSRTEPDVDPHIFGLDGKKLEMDEHYRAVLGDEGLEILRKLKARIEGVLSKFEITVIPAGELGKPVPWLRADPEVLVGHAGEPISVRNAFFFWGI